MSSLPDLKIDSNTKPQLGCALSASSSSSDALRTRLVPMWGIQTGLGIPKHTAGPPHMSDCATAAGPACRDRHVGETCDFQIVPWSTAARRLTSTRISDSRASASISSGVMPTLKFNRIVHSEVSESEINTSDEIDELYVRVSEAICQRRALCAS
jgi:hypothetical protein